MAGGRCPTACVHPRTRGRASPHSIRRSRSLLTAAADADAGCRLRSSAPHKNEKTKKQRPIDADPSGCRPPALPHPQQRLGCREAYLLSAVWRRRSTASATTFSCRAARAGIAEAAARASALRRTCPAAAHPRAVRLVGKARPRGRGRRDRRVCGAKGRTRRNLTERGRGPFNLLSTRRFLPVCQRLPPNGLAGQIGAFTCKNTSNKQRSSHLHVLRRSCLTKVLNYS